MNTLDLLIIFLIFLSTAGYSICASTYLKTPIAFAPATAVGFQVIVLYISALFGVLSYAPLVLLICGFVALVVSVFKDKYFYKKMLTPSFLFFVFASIAISMFSIGRVLVEYDNFSHWGLAVKSMLETNSLPTPDSLVSLYGHPPATTLLYYNAVKLASFSDGVMIAAQGIVVSAFLAAVFHGTVWKKPFKLILTFFAVLAMTCIIYGNLSDLYVDSMLGYVSVALLFMMCTQKGNNRQFISIGFTAFVLALIGNSGIFLVFLMFMYWYVTHLKTGVKEKLMTVICSVCPAILAILSFRLRTKSVFSTSSGYEPLSFEVFKERLGDAEFLSVFKGFAKALFNFGEVYVKYFFFVLLLAVILLYIMCLRESQKRKKYLCSSIGAALVIVIWLIGLYLSYLTMINQYELEHMSGFERYFGTIIIVFTGILVFGISDVVDEIAQKKVEVLCVVLAGFLCPLYFVIKFSCFPPEWKKEDRENKITARQMLVASVEQYSEIIGKDERIYCVIDGLIAEVINEPYPLYDFYSDEAISLSSWNRDNDEWLEKGEYLLYLCAGDDTNDYFTNNFPDKKMKCGLYRIENGDIFFVERLIYE